MTKSKGDPLETRVEEAPPILDARPSSFQKALRHSEFWMIHDALGLQVPPQREFGPSKPTPNTFSEVSWRPRDGEKRHAKPSKGCAHGHHFYHPGPPRPKTLGASRCCMFGHRFHTAIDPRCLGFSQDCGSLQALIGPAERPDHGTVALHIRLRAPRRMSPCES